MKDLLLEVMIQNRNVYDVIDSLIESDSTHIEHLNQIYEMYAMKGNINHATFLDLIASYITDNIERKAVNEDYIKYIKDLIEKESWRHKYQPSYAKILYIISFITGIIVLLTR